VGVIVVDPKVQAAFEEQTARSRQANAEVTGALRESQARLAAQAKERDERLAAERAELKEKAQQLAAASSQQPRKPQWERGPQSSGELALGPEDDEPDTGAIPVAHAPAYAPPPPAPLPPVTQHRRASPVDDDDDDLSGQSWLR
jgi:sRNA-binding protein